MEHRLFLTEATLSLISKIFHSLIVMRQHIVHCVGCFLCAEVDRLEQSTNEVFVLIKLSVSSVRNNVCSMKMIELSKNVGTN
jgi:hypothetical protein